MAQIKNYFNRWGKVRIIRTILAIILFIAYYYNRETLFLIVGIILSAQAIFNMKCPGGSCSTENKDIDKPTMEFKKYEPKKQ